MEKITKDHELAASQNPVATNIEKLRELFPSIVSEDKIDFEALRQLLGDEVTEDEEYFRFVWPGKKQARAEALKSSTGTLRPAPDESLDWDTTQNVYIEGDNLEVLKLLQRSYAGKVKMIYIDPPYNKDKDFIYYDNYRDNLASYREQYGRIDSEGRTVKTQVELNTELSGRYHSRWLNMIFPRLQLARNLLAEDGLVFISIDDTEVDNLIKISNEIFGEDNYISTLVWEKKKKASHLSKDISSVKEYILVLARNKRTSPTLIGEINSNIETYPCINASNPRGTRIFKKGMKSKYGEPNVHLPANSKISVSTMDVTYLTPLIIKDNLLDQDVTAEANWRYNQSSLTEYQEEDNLYFTRDLYIRRIVSESREKTLKDLLPRTGKSRSEDFLKFDSLNLFADGWGSNEDGDIEIRELFNNISIMDYPKPTKLIGKLIASLRDLSDGIILDFFSGSATTAHAILNLNKEDNGNRKYILVQLPEPTDEKKEAHKAGYATIAEIGKERIRRVVKKIKEEEPEKAEAMDLGFRVFKLDSSNIEAWDPDPDKLEDNLFSENIKADRTAHDLVYEILLKYGLDLSLPIEERPGPDARHTLYAVGGGALFLCLGSGITRRAGEAILAWAEEIGAVNPKVVFRDTGFTSSVEKTNAYEVLRSGGVTDVKSV